MNRMIQNPHTAQPYANAWQRGFDGQPMSVFTNTGERRAYNEGLAMRATYAKTGQTALRHPHVKGEIK